MVVAKVAVKEAWDMFLKHQSYQLSIFNLSSTKEVKRGKEEESKP
jgi:hypothetical protein